MNSKKKYLAKCAMAMSLAPFQTHAATGQVGLQACADALVNELSISNGRSVNYKMDAANEGFDSKLQSREVFSLYARDPQSSELVSRMDCVVNSRGKVIRLTNKPLDDKAASKQVSKVD
jgi:hypothetical protein